MRPAVYHHLANVTHILYNESRYQKRNENDLWNSSVDIAFRTRRLERTFNSERELNRAYDRRMARTIMMRLAVLKSSRSLSLVPTTRPDRLHQLIGDRRGQFAVDLVHPFRLIFVPNHDPVPLKEDGGIDRDKVTAIRMLEVVDYH